MGTMFKLLQFKNIRTKISLFIPFVGVALSVALCFLLTIIGMPMYMTIILIFFIISGLAAANFKFIPKNDYLTNKEMIKYYFSRFFYYIVLYILITFACSLGINLVTDAVIGTIFANINPVVGEYINETLLFLVTLIILSKIVIYNGYADTTHKRYNPHMMMSSMLFAFALVFPFVLTDYLYYLIEGENIFSSGVVASRSQFITAYLSAHLNLGFVGVIIGFLIQTALGTVAMLYYYSEGRRNFSVKHPHDLDYDKEQIDSFIAKS